MKICEWNVENLFLLMDLYQNEDLKTISNQDWLNLSTSTTIKNKHIEKVFEISKTILDINADIFMLTEVGGSESLYNLNKYFLNNKYNVYCDNGNSTRGITCGFLVKKNIKCILKSNKYYKLDDNKHFSRDLLSLNFKYKKQDFRFLLTHLKSLRSSDKDPKGIIQRTREVKGIVELYKKMTKENILIAGDFNSDIYIADEFKPLLKTDLIDIHKLQKSTEQERATFAFFDRNRNLNQLDYIMLNKNLQSKFKNAYTYYFKNDYGDSLGLPESIYEKKMNPSDHFPLICNLKI